VARNDARGGPAPETAEDFVAFVAYCCGSVVNIDLRVPAHVSTYLGSFRIRGFNSSFSLSVDKSRMTGIFLPVAMLFIKSRRAVPERKAAAEGRLNVFGRFAIRCTTLVLGCNLVYRRVDKECWLEFSE
jgi:hypothetical protein